MSVTVYERQNDKHDVEVEVKYLGKYDSFHIGITKGKSSGVGFSHSVEHVDVVTNNFVSKLLSIFSGKNSRQLTKDSAIKKADKAFDKKLEQLEREKKLEKEIQE